MFESDDLPPTLPEELARELQLQVTHHQKSTRSAHNSPIFPKLESVVEKWYERISVSEVVRGLSLIAGDGQRGLEVVWDWLDESTVLNASNSRQHSLVKNISPILVMQSNNLYDRARPPASAMTHFTATCDTLVSPFIDRVKKKIDNQVRAGAHFLPVSSIDVCDDFTQALLQRFTKAVSRSVIREFRLAAEGHWLVGSNTEEDWFAFYHICRTNNFREAFWSRYPALLHYFDEATPIFLDAFDLFFKRLRDDWPTLVERRLVIEEDTIAKILCGRGDWHNKSQSVCEILMSSGKTLFYKPRAMWVEQKILSILNDLLRDIGLAELRVPEMYCLNNYGWSAAVKQGNTGTVKQLQAALSNLGAVFCFFYILGVTDMHEGNFVSSGDQLIPIDLETAMDPYLGSILVRKDCNYLEDRLSSVGVLPFSIFEKGTGSEENSSAVLDFSVLASPRERRWMVNSLLVVAEDKNNELYLQRKTAPVPTSHILHPLALADNHLIRSESYFALGFKAMYKHLLNSGNRFYQTLEENLIDANIRVVLRETRIYSRILRESFHPDLVRSVADRALFLAHIAEEVVPLTGADIWVSEVDDLLHGDIPFFRHKVNDKNLVDSQGRTWENCFDLGGLEGVKKRLTEMSQEQLTVLLATIHSRWVSSS